MSIVQYNQSTRQWQTWPEDQDYTTALIAGAVVAFPAGREGKRAAMLAALRNDRPDICDEVEAIIENHPSEPAIIDRSIRAGQLVAGGHIRAPLPTTSPYSYLNEVARVASQTGNGEHYAISEHPRALWCTCQDHENGFRRWVLPQDHPERPKFGAPPMEGIGFACKHIIAWLICCAMMEDEEISVATAATETNTARILREAKETNERGQAALEFALKHQGDLGRGHVAARMNGLDF